MLLYIIYPFIALFIIYISKKINLVDEPSDRKLHIIDTPFTGGLSIFIFYILFINQFEFVSELEMIITIGTFIIFAGIIDDKFKLTPGVKLIFISFPIFFLVFNNFLIVDLGTYEYFGRINLGKFAIPFTILCIGLFINAYNYIDGIDGLALSIAIKAFLYLFILIDNEPVKNFLLFLTFPLIINLILNLMPQKTSLKLFLGNNGSLFIGFVLSFILIYCYKSNILHPSIFIWTIWYPVYDFLFVNIYRLVNKRNIFEAGKDHFHHYIFIKLNKSHLKTLFFINILNIIIITISFYINEIFGALISLVTFVSLFFLYSFVVSKLYRKISF